MKKQFINSEIWILTFAGGFQRANVYKDNPSEKARLAFRQAIRSHIETLVATQYHNSVSEEGHLQNIWEISRKANKLKIDGLEANLNFGIAQKLLNLYLKYRWSLGTLKAEPPHFPVDRMIQEALNREAKKYGVKLLKIEPWTQFDSEEKYLAVIRFAEALLSKNILPNVMSIAELELYLFSQDN